MPHPPMTYARLGSSGVDVSILTLGTMMFGDRTDAADAREIVAHARDAGVNFIDTADVYAKGESERITGAAIRAERDRWMLATKVGNKMDASERNNGGLSRSWILRACDASLARLGTDHIDVYYLHSDDPATPIDETIARDRRPDPRGQDPLLRRVELPRLAHRRGDAHLRARSACRSRSSASRTTTC